MTWCVGFDLASYLHEIIGRLWEKSKTNPMKWWAMGKNGLSRWIIFFSDLLGNRILVIIEKRTESKDILDFESTVYKHVRSF